MFTVSRSCAVWRSVSLKAAPTRRHVEILVLLIWRLIVCDAADPQASSVIFVPDTSAEDTRRLIAAFCFQASVSPNNASDVDGRVGEETSRNCSEKDAAQLNNTSKAAIMVLGALFSLQNNILNATVDGTALGVLGLRYVAAVYPNATTVAAAAANSSVTIPSLFDHDLLSSENFAAYASTSSQAVEHDALPNGTSRGELIPVFELVLGAVTYMVIIAMTVIGNILVVIAVFSYRPLKKVQNYFLVSLAASDLAVALIVMPLHVVKFLADGRWLLGVTMCQIFTTFDILLCTSSIWNLLAIAIDRYFAIHDPIDYAQKRTPKFVCTVIAVVWLVSIMISVPPIIGWNDWSSQKLMDHCELTTEKAFVVYSASGSFFVPLCVMVVVYVKIFLSARERIRTNRGRSALLKIGTQANMSPGTSSECVAPRFARLTPLVATTTTSVAHLLQRSTKSKNKAAAVSAPPIKSKRSMSHASGAIMINGALLARRAQLMSPRAERSNSSGGALVAVPAPAVSRLAALAQHHYRNSTSGSHHTLNDSSHSIVNNYCNTMQQTMLGDGAASDNHINSDRSKRPSYSSNNSAVDDRNNKLLFVITTEGPSTNDRIGVESMINDELTTNTVTTTTSSSSATSSSRTDLESCRRPSTPIPSELQWPSGKALTTDGNAGRMPKNGILKNSSDGGISVKDIINDQQTVNNALKNRERISVAKEKRAAKTIAVIIFVFTFCWMPFFCVYVILPFCTTCYIHPKVNQAVVWLGYINSSLNPFLYGILNLEFRRAFRKILCPKRFTNHQKQQHFVASVRRDKTA